MSAEDRLRDILRSEAQTVTPAGDGLAKIQERVARRRRLRLWTIPSTVLATTGALLAFLAISPDERTTQTLVPGQTPSPTVSASPVAGPSVTAVPADSHSGPAVWPFTSQAQAEAWDSQAMPWADDSLEVGRRFVKDFLGLTDVTLRQDCVSCEVLVVVADGRDAGTLVLAHYAAGGKHLFTVVSVEAPDLKVTTPEQGADVTSPLSVSGTVEGVDESIRVRLVTDGGKQVAEAFAPAGAGTPWRTSLSWSDRSWNRGALVLRTGNHRDGVTNRLVVLAVTQGTPVTGPSFAALVDGHVSLYDGSSGSLIRQLTFPPTGKRDVEAAWANSSVLWTRQPKDGDCGGELDLRGLDQTVTVATSASVRYRHPELSDDATWLGWVEQPCNETSPHVLVVSGRPGPAAEPSVRRITGPSGSLVQLLDVREDGAALVLTNDRQPSGPGTIGLLPARATKMEGLTPIAPEAGCNLTDAAFDGELVVGFQWCEDGIQLVRWRSDGSVAGKDRAVSDEPVESISISAGLVLVQRFGGDSVGRIATYASGSFHDLITPDPAHCTSTSDQKGCVTSPDW